MKKAASFILSLLLFNAIFAQPKTMKTLHDFKAITIDGREFDLALLKGKKVLVVNTASKCGNTPQYEELQKLYEKYKGQNFTIVGFPANNFGKQEPGTNTEIAEFCKKNYGVAFQMMAKISVKGDDTDPIYQWLTRKDQNGVADAEVKWNFQKFMIDENGKWVDFVSADDSPMNEKIIKWIEGKK